VVAFVEDEERRRDERLALGTVSVPAKDSGRTVECSFDGELGTDEVEEGEHPKLVVVVVVVAAAVAVDSYHEGGSYRR
jgi:hypothetical protein